MTKKVETPSLYRVYLRNLFSDIFFKNPDCSVTQTPLPPSLASLIWMVLVFSFKIAIISSCADMAIAIKLGFHKI